MTPGSCVGALVWATGQLLGTSGTGGGPRGGRHPACAQLHSTRRHAPPCCNDTSVLRRQRVWWDRNTARRDDHQGGNGRRRRPRRRRFPPRLNRAHSCHRCTDSSRSGACVATVCASASQLSLSAEPQGRPHHADTLRCVRPRRRACVSACASACVSATHRDADRSVSATGFGQLHNTAPVPSARREAARKRRLWVGGPSTA